MLGNNMNRRKFLQYTGITLAGMLVPLTASAKLTGSEDDPTTVEELIAAIEKRFDCSMGYPGPFVFKSYDWDSTPRKYQYETYTLMGYRDHPRTKENLVRSIWYALKQYPEGAKMYWRLDYKISMEDFEQTLADGWTPSGNMMTKIRTRVAFPFEYKG
jgi:hypothetical protein